MPDYKAKEVSKGNLWTNDGRTGKQPHFRGEIQVDHDIPAGAKIGLAGWLNEQGNKRSLFFAVSCKEEELESKDKEGELPF